MPRMTVNGVSLAYEEYGEGFPFVWCHDYAGSMDVWKPQIQHFPALSRGRLQRPRLSTV